jgi:DNA-binding NtrC family response regulator
MPLQAALASALAEEQRLRIIVGATPHLVELVQLGRFDRDLNLLLSRVAVHVPPLRDRSSDIGAIAAAHDAGRTLAAPTVAALAEYAWPGNILELIEALARARMLSPGSHLTAGAVRRVLGNRPRRWRGFDVLPLRELEHRYLLTVLARFGGNRSRAAHHLGISRNTLARKLQGCIEPNVPERYGAAPSLLHAAP